jgi:hypothetical protein
MNNTPLVREALCLVTRLRKILQEISPEAVELDDAHVKTIYDIINRAGRQGIISSKLLAATHRLDRTLRDKALDALVQQTKIVCIVKRSESGKGRPSLKYTATCHIEDEVTP